ncbi:MAG: tRNA (N6-threonylcarbamoyladenosine(37)-N6)-methyltransferase TrmO [endosymbiont of Seepiophila jonesi]|uniref:tRNA (N6-threonylcarbamoyladenosine(37)-N6)-methyltransferase TrmO n=1 Tax=endosymbiont of Lamellibrachia luymesi TaxID=2200907 RepID=A0A370E0C8_9GAMM|nr:MAG: tRNA (N6-threonylcarbamoyladenosine(37)-N6)-methyltransferase TrmO [endosymbiont of Lamellibrachia luymesi]RDH94234.1 MAG: tRNA (N6-threonylcarbamoyladenosine(37)-N6)-methyltransferase TrmO [endosymbiont of Seepiophila jonesi]
MKYEFTPIGIIHSCFKEKFGIPRQPGLIPEAVATLEIVPPFNRPEAFKALEGYSHIWINFVFHAALREQWKPMVRPPRLGGNQRVGVFASRSPFRPNPIGLSVVRLNEVKCNDKGVELRLSGIDLLDGTPVLDIKPYLPYTDAIPDAHSGYAPDPPGQSIALSYSSQAEAWLENVAAKQADHIRRLLRQVFENDPRPAYLKAGSAERKFGMTLYDFNVSWMVENNQVNITEIKHLSAPED